MKIYLLNPPYYKNFMRSARWARPAFAGSQWYPIFLAYATGFLEKNGHIAKLVDGQVRGLDFDQVLKDVKSFSPEIAVIYTSLPSLENDIKLAEKIKKQENCLIVFAGPWCSYDQELILNKSEKIDVVIRKEIELPLLNLAQKKNIAEIKGISWKKDGKIIHNPDENFLIPEQLDSFPFVTEIYRKHLNIKDYNQTSLKYPFVDLFSGRGCCWGQCIFCLWPHTIFKGAPLYRKRSVKNVIEELKSIKKNLPEVKEVFFQDDTLPKDRAVEISEEILKNNLKLTWSCYAKPILDYKTLELMKKAGCRCLHVGYESADQNILTFAKKGQTPELMEKFTKDAKKAGLIIHADFLIGLPGENEKTILKTINWAKSLGLLDYQFAVIQPEPGTPLYDFLKKNGFSTGEDKVDYPEFSCKNMFDWRLKAYKKIYLDPKYLLRLSKNPAELKRVFKMAIKAAPNLIFKKSGQN
jgi:anaerobic magnesium-protoporphyrin IX monomethyl ester cyclase